MMILISGYTIMVTEKMMLALGIQKIAIKTMTLLLGPTKIVSEISFSHYFTQKLSLTQ